MGQTIFIYLPIVVGIIFAIVFVFIFITVISFFTNPTKKMKKMAKDMVEMQNEILRENKEILKESADISAEIEEDAIITRTRAVKTGFSGESSTTFCRWCGSLIDSDSTFCENCGRKL